MPTTVFECQRINVGHESTELAALYGIEAPQRLVQLGDNLLIVVHPGKEPTAYFRLEDGQWISGVLRVTPDGQFRVCGRDSVN